MTKAFAQQTTEQALKARMNPDELGLTAKQAVTKVGDSVYVCDRVYRYESKKHFVKKACIGNKDSLQSLYVIFQNNIKLQETNFKGSKLCISGKIVAYKGHATIIVSSPGQLGNRILL